MGDKREPVTAVVAQKNSVANSIKKVFPEYLVTSVAGHIKKLVFKKYNNTPWLKISLPEVLEDQLIYVNSEFARTSLRNLEVINNCPEFTLILALDPDQEGQLIGQHVLSQFNRSKLKDVYKVNLESLSESGIRKAFSERHKLSGSEGHSAELRSRLDLLFGTILSRAVSLDTFSKTKRWTTFNSGRVQTPTLNFVRERELERKNFKSELYQMIKIEDNPHIGPLLLPHRFSHLDPLSELEVSHLRSERVTVPPRLGLNTDSLLSLLASEHAVFKKINTSTTGLLSALYLSGKITYPRTDNNEFNNYKDLLQETALLFERETSLKAIVPEYPTSSKVSDHSPICPLVLSSLAETDLEKKVLDTLFNHLKKVYLGPNEYVKHHLSVRISGKELKFHVLEVIEKNFEDDLVSSRDVKIPREDNGKFLVPVRVESRETKPPSQYTSSTLLQKMKRCGVGTKSTRATIIENLLKNGYLVYSKNNLNITEKGVYLCSYWSHHWSQITSPTLTENIESMFPITSREVIAEVQKKYKKELKALIDSIFNRPG